MNFGSCVPARVLLSWYCSGQALIAAMYLYNPAQLPLSIPFVVSMKRRDVVKDALRCSKFFVRFLALAVGVGPLLIIIMGTFQRFPAKRANTANR
jgi:hypothetical protein